MKNYLTLFCFLYAPLFAQNKVEGDCLPQPSPNTCWAAALSNVSRVNWNRENRLTPDLLTRIEGEYSKTPDHLEYIATSYFNFRFMSFDSILTWEAINSCFSYRFPRPLIYGYHLYDSFSTEGHFVNIVGTRELRISHQNHQKWLEIYNPKPDGLGSRFLKNYNAYTYTWYPEFASNTQSTFYQFVDKRLKLPSEIPNSKLPIKNWTTIQLEDVICDKTAQAFIESALRINPELSDFLGSQPEFSNTTWPVIAYIDSNKSSSSSNSISFDVKDNGFMMPVFNGEKIKAGIFFVNAKHLQPLEPPQKGIVVYQEPCYMINTIEEISRMGRALQNLFNNRKSLHNIIFVNPEYRFLKTQNNDYYDLDGFFGQLYQQYDQNSFFEKLLNKKNISVEELNDVEFGKKTIRVEYKK